MANYNKSFNFRNGVQVDEDDLIVRSSLVGIGTTIPRADLDVYGTVRSTGIITANDLYVTGVATFTNIQIGLGITIDGNAGIITATFAGDGSGLYNIPTSQWVDVDPAIYPGVGVGYSSIWAGGTVGIGTTIPRFWLQVGGDPGLSQNGVGISSIGDINASGIVTGGSFVGSGADITNINASNIASGTLDTARLSSNISVSGVVTAQTFSGQVNSGVATITTLDGTTGTITNLTSTNLSGTIGTVTTLESTTGTVTNLTSTNLSGTIGTVTTLESTSGTITNLSGTIGTVTTLNGTNLNYSGIATLGFATIGVATIGVASVTSGIFENLNSTNLDVSGITTVGFITASSSYLGFSTSRTLQSGNIRVATPIETNIIDTISGDLILDSSSGLTIIDDNLRVSGISTLNGQVIVDTGIVPDTNTGAYLGQSGRSFSEAHINAIQIGVGVGNESKINTSSGDLILDSDTSQIIIDGNLSVAGITTFSDLSIQNTFGPDSDLGASLGSSLNRFNAAHINAIRIGIAQTFEIDTSGGTDLVLNSSSGNTRVNDNLFVSGIGSFAQKITSIGGISPHIPNGSNIGEIENPFNSAYVNDITIANLSPNEINTRSGNLILGSQSNIVDVNGNLSISDRVTVGSAISVNNSSYFVGVSTFVTSILPLANNQSSIGSSEKFFSKGYIDEISSNVINANEIISTSGNLVLSGYNFENLVVINSPLNVTGIVTFDSDLLPISDSTVSIGTFGRSFGQAFINNIQVGYSASTVIDTRSGDLVLDSNTGKVVINQDFEVLGNSILNTVDFGNTLTIDNINERVGIGSTLPSQELSVVGNSIITGNLFIGENNSIILDGTSETVTIKDLVVTGSTVGVTAVGSGVSVAGVNYSTFGVAQLLVFNEDFLLSPIASGITTISLSPNIGIGTTVIIGIGTDIVDPDVKLHVEGSIFVSESILVNNSVVGLDGFTSGIGTPVQINGDDSIGAFSLSAIGIGTIIIPGPIDPNDIVTLQNVWEYVDVDSAVSIASSIGIGTTNPSSTLDVHGDISVTGVTTSQGGFTSGIGVTNPVQITVSGNVLTFTVPGVGTTTLTLL